MTCYNLPGLLTALKQCSKTENLQKGRELHMHAVETGCHTNKHVATALIRMYGKVGRLLDAKLVFDAMLNRDIISWTSLILAFVENGESLAALDLFQSIDCLPDSFTFATACKACAGLASVSVLKKEFCLEKAIGIHRRVIELGFDMDVFVASSMIDMYSKFGLMSHAWAVFHNMNYRDVVSWNIIVLGYVENGRSIVALELFEGMDCRPNSSTILAVCKACSGLHIESQMRKEFCLEKGIIVHMRCRLWGITMDLSIMNALIDMYSKCHSIHHARAVFDSISHRNVVSWTSLILGYVENNNSVTAIDLFMNMDCEPDSITVIAALKSCLQLFNNHRKTSREFCLEVSFRLHKIANHLGFDTDTLLTSNLIDTYSKIGSMRHARAVFDSISFTRDIVPWNSLILGYVENGESAVALELFARIDCQPNHITFFAALKACGCLGALSVGQKIHADVRDVGLEQNNMVATSLIDLYASCGTMALAEEVFGRMHDKDIAAWNALIVGYMSSGDTASVFKVVKRLDEAGLQPNGITFLSILTACSHLGLVEEGYQYLESMRVYGLEAGVEHYTCIVDMLGRANRLEEALTVVESMPCKANNVVWTCLLGACRKWRNVELGKIAFAALTEFESLEARVINMY